MSEYYKRIIRYKQTLEWVLTSNEILNSAWIEMNNTNSTMHGSGINWWINVSQVWGFSYQYKVYGNDSAGNLGFSETRTISLLNSEPLAIDVAIISSDILNRTNATLTGTWNFSDSNQDSQVLNETASQHLIAAK